MKIKQKKYKIEKSLLTDKIILNEAINLNENAFTLEFTEMSEPGDSSTTSMIIYRKLKGVSVSYCESVYIDALNYLSPIFGDFKALDGALPNDYRNSLKEISETIRYRQIQSPRGQITFQSKLGDTSLPFELKVLGPVFTAYREKPDCNLLFWFDSK